MRFDPPLLGLFRTTANDEQIGDTLIPAHSKVLTHYGAANRDPAVFENPDVFDVGRPSRKILSFGLGIHVCLGRELALLEAEVTLDALRQQPQIAAPDANFVVSAAALRRLPARLAKRQAAFARTGGLHCAGLFDSVGVLSDSFEDVGRHNALDKLVGASVLSGNLPWSSHGIMLSGRSSFELLQKAMMAGAPLVAGPKDAL